MQKEIAIGSIKFIRLDILSCINYLEIDLGKMSTYKADLQFKSTRPEVARVRKGQEVTKMCRENNK